MLLCKQSISAFSCESRRLNFRKYIKLGYANEKVNQKSYAEAEAFYDEILVDFPGDKETIQKLICLITKTLRKEKKLMVFG
jgi:hypothetical protein